MVGPLIQYSGRELRNLVRNRVLGDDYRAAVADETVDSVVDLGVDVVGAAGEHDYRKSAPSRLGDVFFALGAHLGEEFVALGVCRLAGKSDLFWVETVEIFRQDSIYVLREVLRTVYSDVVLDEFYVSEPRHIRTNDLGVVGHDRTVVVVVAETLVEVVGHAGVEYRVDSRVEQSLDVTVHQLRREADRVGRDSLLSGQVELAVAARRYHDLEIEARKEGVPERQKFVHIQSHRQTDFRARILGFTVITCEQVQLVLVQVEMLALLSVQSRALTAVAADEAASAVERVDGQAAVVLAESAGRDLYVVAEILQRVG